MSDEIAARLKTVPIFEGVSGRDLKSIASSCKEIERDPGDVITSEGEGGIGFFLILEGAAEVKVGDTVLRTLGTGDHFGEIALIDGGPRTATITITAPTRLAGLSAWTFRPLLSEHPEMTQALLLSLCKMIRSYTET